MAVNKKYIYLLLVFLVFQHLSSNVPLCISLGSACGAAMQLRALGLRLEAYPFDWTTTSISSLVEAIRDDFKHILTNLKILPSGDGVKDYYGISFTHDLPTTNYPHHDALNTEFTGAAPLSPGWEQAVSLVKEKYRRRIERLRVACNSKEKVFFIRSQDVSKEQAIAIRDCLKSKYPALDFMIVVFKHEESFKQPWNIDGIRNFYITGWVDAEGCAVGLKQIDPEFKDIEVLKDMYGCDDGWAYCGHDA